MQGVAGGASLKLSVKFCKFHSGSGEEQSAFLAWTRTKLLVCFPAVSKCWLSFSIALHGQGDFHGKGEAQPLGAFHQNPILVPLHNGLAQRQAQALRWLSNK
jgi:hypothetical protein